MCLATLPLHTHASVVESVHRWQSRHGSACLIWDHVYALRYSDIESEWGGGARCVGCGVATDG
eukprot:4363997-Amphidinium_carterae.1